LAFRVRLGRRCADTFLTLIERKQNTYHRLPFFSFLTISQIIYDIR
jgi:hypothetical protein